MIRQRSRRSRSSRLLESLESRNLFSTTIATTTSLVASAAAASVGQSITFTALVSTSDSLNGQWVQLWDNGTLFAGSAQLTDNSATIQWTPLAGGLHTITAEFPAQGDLERSVSTPIFFNAFRHPAVVALDANSLPGGKTQLQFTVSPMESISLAPTGKVDVFENGHLITTATLGSADTLTLQLSTGLHVVTASYRGDGAFFPASASQSVTVRPAPAAVANLDVSWPVLTHSHFPVAIPLTTVVLVANSNSPLDSISSYLAPDARQYYGRRPQPVADPSPTLATVDELAAGQNP